MKTIKYIIFLIFILILISKDVFADKSSLHDIYRNIIKLANIEESEDNMKEAVLAYKDMLEKYPDKYWTIAAQDFMLLGPGVNIDRAFEEYIKPDSEVNILVLCTLYFYQWPEEFEKYITKIENSSSIYGLYAQGLKYAYYAGLAPDRPKNYEKSVEYLKNIINKSNVPKEIMIDAYMGLGCCNLSMLKNPAEAVKIFNNILSQTSSDVELTDLYNSNFRKELYIVLIQSHSENGEREISKKYFDLLKKDFPEYKEFDVLEKMYIDPTSHPMLEIK